MKQRRPLVPRVTALALVLAAACNIYGEADDESPRSPSNDPTSDAGVAVEEAGDPFRADATVTVETGTEPPDASATDSASASEGGPDAAPLRDLYAFVTSTAVTGRIASSLGQSAADQRCEVLARTSGLLANRTFRAWLGGNQGPPTTRIVGPAVGHRFLRVDGLPLSNDATNMHTKALLAPLNVDEGGATVASSTAVWTGTNSLGGATSNTCDSWSSEESTSFGYATTVSTVGGWTGASVRACNLPAHLYCFELP